MFCLCVGALISLSSGGDGEFIEVREGGLAGLIVKCQSLLSCLCLGLDCFPREVSRSCKLYTVVLPFISEPFN